MDNKKENILEFPKGFFWGASTSSYQVEGGIINDWSEWEKSEKRKNELKSKKLNLEDFISGKACNSYELFDEDLKCIKELNLTAYRFSIEWSRVEPIEGKFNEEAVGYYKKIIKKLRENNIEPFVTIWHFTNPLWIRDLGGWENKKTVFYYLRFLEKLIDSFGGQVKFWITLNEPQIYTGLSYASGVFPPQVKSLLRANKVFKNLMLAHKKAYILIHKKLGPRPMVGLSHNLIYYTACRKNIAYSLLIRLLDYILGSRFVRAIGKHQDFIGLQYYHHDRVRMSLGGKFIIACVDNENKDITDMGWEIYPEGIYHILKSLIKYNKPIYLTENGIADRIDKKRAKFIKDHLYYIHKAIKEGAPVKSYIYWSLLDNFEWAHGWDPKFGLYAVDRKTFKRTARPSAKIYSEICRDNKVIF